MKMEFECQYCGLVYKSAGELTNHLVERHDFDKLSRIDRKRVEQYEQSTSSGLQRLVGGSGFSRRAVLASVGAGAVGAVATGGISAAQEAQQNIGFDFNWEYGGPAGHEAAFIQDDGQTLTVCSGNFPNNDTCNFVVEYEVDSASQLEDSESDVVENEKIISSGDYGTFNDGECPGSPETPLTLANCFNANSFGQLFTPDDTGSITKFEMDMTFLNTEGGVVEGFGANLFNIGFNEGTPVLDGGPIESISLDFSGLEHVTKTSWEGYTFGAGDFATVNIPFSSEVTSGEHYGVFFEADFVPGEDGTDDSEGGTVTISDTTITDTETGIKIGDS